MSHRDFRRVLQRFAALVIGAALAACVPAERNDPAAQRLAEREAIEQVLARANLGFELSDPDLFANAFAEDAV